MHINGLTFDRPEIHIVCGCVTGTAEQESKFFKVAPKHCNKIRSYQPKIFQVYSHLSQ